jgi:hypothetical protein
LVLDFSTGLTMSLPQTSQFDSSTASSRANQFRSE